MEEVVLISEDFSGEVSMGLRRKRGYFLKEGMGEAAVWSGRHGELKIHV